MIQCSFRYTQYYVSIRKEVIVINKPAVYSGVTIAFAALALTGLGMKNVEANFSPNEIVTKIAERFNLNKDDVQSVFNQFRQERQSKVLETFATKLDESVKAGKISDAQKQLILNKMKEEQTAREAEMASGNTKTPEERKSDRQKHKTELQSWATANGIPIEFLMRGPMGKGMGRGIHK